MEILKLVTEFQVAEAVSEDINNQKHWTLNGIGIQTEVKNGNGRYYAKTPMMEQVEIYCNEYLTRNRAVGELNHPEKSEDQVKINPDRIACKFIDVKIEDNNVRLKAKPTIGTPCGDIVNNLLNNGVVLGFSSRALAKLTKTKDYVLTECKKIITLADVVYDPSVGNDALIQGVLEDKDWVYENGVIVEAKNFEEVVEDCRNQFKSMTSKSKNQVVKKVVRKYFESLFRNL